MKYVIIMPDAFLISNALKVGDVLSQLLFKNCLEYAIMKFQCNQMGHISPHSLGLSLVRISVCKQTDISTCMQGPCVRDACKLVVLILVVGPMRMCGSQYGWQRQ
jgi:hypothetical protein